MRALDSEQNIESRSVDEDLSDKLDVLLSLIEDDTSVAHLAPILVEAQKAAEKGPEFSHEDIIRVADLVMGLPGVLTIDDAIARARIFKEHAKPNMFARAVSFELERRKGSAG